MALTESRVELADDFLDFVRLCVPPVARKFDEPPAALSEVCPVRRASVEHCRALAGDDDARARADVRVLHTFRPLRLQVLGSVDLEEVVELLQQARVVLRANGRETTGSRIPRGGP